MWKNKRKKEEEEIKKREKAEEEEEDETDDEDDEIKDDEDLDSSVQAELEERAKQAKQYYADELDEDDNSEASGSDLGSDDEEGEFPMDDIDELLYFIEFVKDFSAKQPQAYNGIVPQLDAPAQSAFRNLAQLAEQRKIENAKK